MSIAKFQVVLAGLATFTATGPVLAAPQTFNTALPVAEEEFVYRQQFFNKRASNDPTPANRDVNVNGSISVLGYGINSDLAIFGVLPLLDKTLWVTPAATRLKRDTSGIGDARLFARYTLFRDDAPGRTFRIAPFGGIKIPTGKSRVGDAFGTLPPALQLGTGSWDPFAGVVATWQTRDYQLDGQVSYKLNTEANNYQFGDEMRFDASLQYRLLPRELSDDTTAFFYGLLESNLVYKQKDRLDGVQQANTGGTQLFIAPGIQYVTRSWIAEAIVQIPIVQNLNGTALKDDYTIRVGFRMKF